MALRIGNHLSKNFNGKLVICDESQVEFEVIEILDHVIDVNGITTIVTLKVIKQFF